MSLLIAIALCFSDDWTRRGGNDGDFSAPVAPLALEWPEGGPPELWRRPSGDGHSGLIVQDGKVFAHYQIETGRDRVMAVDASTGEPIWSRDLEANARSEQESYGGGTGPHATPLAIAGQLITLDFGGRVRAQGIDDGRVTWSLDLVEALAAKPVQFGFAASPIPWKGRAVITVGGEQAGLISVAPSTGEIAWRSDGFAASYVTPRILEVGGENCIAVLTVDDVRLIAPESGKTVSILPHRKLGLTNFAPMVVDDAGGLLVSGQGTGGTRRLTWNAVQARFEEDWFGRRLELSHGSAVRFGAVVCTSLGATLAAYHARNGGLLWQERGFPEASLLRVGPALLILDEVGVLSLALPGSDGLEVLAQYPVLKEKAWTAPTLAGTRLYLRDREKIVALELKASDGARSLLNVSSKLSKVEAPMEVSIPESMLEHCVGTYLAESGDEIRIVRDGDSLRDRAGESAWTAMSDDSFTLPDGRIAQFLPGEGGGIGQLELRRDDVVTTWKKRPPEIVSLPDASIERCLGRYTGDGDLVLRVFLQDGEARLKASIYGDFEFRLEPESDTVFWVRPIDVPFGVPATKMVFELDGERVTSAKIHQITETTVVTKS